MLAAPSPLLSITSHEQPDYVDAYIGLGLALEADGYVEDAMIALRSAIELGGGNICVCVWIGWRA